MHHFFVKPEQIVKEQGRKTVCIDGPDFHHASQVLRIRPGEELLISDGTGKDYRCRVVAVENEEMLTYVLHEEEERELPASLILYQSLVKGEKMEWIIQKAVELGVSRIVPVVSENTIVKLEKKKEESRLQRWQAIAQSAAKQSKRSKIPEIGQVLTLKEALCEAGRCDIRLFAYEHEEGMSRTVKELEKTGAGKEIAVFIGPEGGYSPKEAELARECGFSPVSLGKRILRAETAGLALLSGLMLKLEFEKEKIYRE